MRVKFRRHFAAVCLVILVALTAKYKKNPKPIDGIDFFTEKETEAALEDDTAPAEESSAESEETGSDEAEPPAENAEPDNTDTVRSEDQE